MSHERTVRKFMSDLRTLGFKVSLKPVKSGFGYYLEGPSGERASIGDKGPDALLSPREQEAHCENLGLDATLLGLDPPAGD